MSAEECLEEQAMELETVQSLYPESYQHVTDKPRHSFTLDLQPHPDSDEPNHVSVRMHVEFPSLYPLGGEPPVIIASSLKGLSPAKVKELNDLLRHEMAEDNPDSEIRMMIAEGMPVMFNVCSIVTDYLINNNIPSDTSLLDQSKAHSELKQRLSKMKGADILEEEKALRDAHSMTDLDSAAYKRRMGTPCTRDTFAEWNLSFLDWFRAKEAAEEKEREARLPAGLKGDKLTGKEIFQEMNERQMKENLAKMQIGSVSAASSDGASLMSGDSDEDCDSDERVDPADQSTSSILTADSSMSQLDPTMDEVLNSDVGKQSKRSRKKKRKKGGKSGSSSSSSSLMSTVSSKTQGKKSDAASAVSMVTDESLFLDMDL